MSYSIYDRYEDEYPDDDRQCEKCIHYCSYNDPASGCKKGCSAWECSFEEKEPMTIEDAIDIICTETDIDYGDRNEAEVERIDKAFDVLITTVKKYVKRDCAEWEDWVDGATGRLTNAGKCNKCGIYNAFKTKFCPHCGRQMKEWQKTGDSK